MKFLTYCLVSILIAGLGYCNRTHAQNLPSGDIGSVVFSTTHDLERIDGQNPALNLGQYSNFITTESENYKIILITCYLLQRIYNVPLIFQNQINFAPYATGSFPYALSVGTAYFGGGCWTASAEL